MAFMSADWRARSVITGAVGAVLSCRSRPPSRAAAGGHQNTLPSSLASRMAARRRWRRRQKSDDATARCPGCRDIVVVTLREVVASQFESGSHDLEVGFFHHLHDAGILVGSWRVAWSPCTRPIFLDSSARGP